MTSPVVALCPKSELFALQVIVVGMDGAPLNAVAVALAKAGDTSVLSRTVAAGLVRFSGLEVDVYQLSLHELDEAAWELISTEPLAEADVISAEPAHWTATPKASSSAFTHVIQQGEGTTRVATHYGFFADAVWSNPANSDLQQKREDMNILMPGDSLTIPAKQVMWIGAAVQNRYTLRRKGVPATLQIRF